MIVRGFNQKEQLCYDLLCDGELHYYGEMKIPFRNLADDDLQAHSMVRNSMRRLVRDGWVERVCYGTYKLSELGKQWTAEGKDITASFGRKRGLRGKKKRKEYRRPEPAPSITELRRLVNQRKKRRETLKQRKSTLNTKDFDRLLRHAKWEVIKGKIDDIRDRIVRQAVLERAKKLKIDIVDFILETEDAED